MYNFTPNPNEHVKIFKGVLEGAIDQAKEDSVQAILKTQKAYFDLFYSWDNRVNKWNQLLASILHKAK